MGKERAAMHPSSGGGPTEQVVVLPAGRHGTLESPAVGAKGVVVFAHGSGSGRFSPRNRRVAATLRHAGFATLLSDLLTEEEATDRRNVFDTGLLAGRLEAAIECVAAHAGMAGLPVGLFGASTGAAAALAVAALRPGSVGAVVSRGGRPDLAGEARLLRVAAPTLLIVGGEDREVLRLNEWARSRMTCPTELAVIPGATHLFEEAGALERAADLAAAWFRRWLDPEPDRAAA